MKRIVLLSVAIALIFLAGNVSSAHAQGGCVAGGAWGGFGINFPYGLYGSRVNQVPYYAMFPPVYYSQPVPRSYGWSPFAYPPGTMTPEVAVEVPQEVINPYVPQREDAKSSSATRDKTAKYQAPIPQVVINPYVKGMNLASTASGAR